VSSNDRTGSGIAEVGDFQTSSDDELIELLRVYDQDRFLGHIPKVQLIRGDASETIPEFVQQNRHLLVSLLFIDLDLYAPTKAALEHILPRMPKGSIVAFDELDNPIWPGETEALLEKMQLNRLKIQRLEWDPYIGFAVLE
jgi:predicted O-methyltransferase YrrM